jgi:hypothetical protein
MLKLYIRKQPGTSRTTSGALAIPSKHLNLSLSPKLIFLKSVPIPFKIQQ